MFRLPLFAWTLLLFAGAAAHAGPLGDVNADGRVNAADVLLVRSHLAGERLLSPAEQAAADVAPLVAGVPQPDAVVDVADLLVLVRVTRGEVGLNRAPQLAPLGPQSVAVGSVLAFTVSAMDPDGDPVALTVLPLPLPGGAEFSPTTGDLQFVPRANQVGTFTLSFAASDGDLSATQDVPITVEPALAGAATEITGRVLDATDQTPIEGVTVRELDCTGSCSAVTDANGDFTLAGLTPGERSIEFDGSTALGPIVYLGYRALLDVAPDRTLVLARPVYLVRFEGQGSTPIPPTGDTVVSNPSLGSGFSLVVGEGTIEDENGNPVTTGQVNVTSVPPDFTPGALPDVLVPDQVITVQPVGTGTSQLVFTQPAQVTFENTQGYAPGSIVDIWSLDHATGRFFVAGTGQVSMDGTVIETIDGGIRETSWHFVMATAAEAGVAADAAASFLEGGSCSAAGPPPAGQAPAEQGIGSTLTLANGCLGTSVALPAMVTRGAPRAVELVYKSARAHPRPVIPFEPVIPVLSAVPDLLSYEVLVGGVGDGSRTFVDTSGLDENQPETVRAAVSFDATTLPTGTYPIRIRTTSHYPSASVGSNLFTNVTVVNGQESPLGAGWEVAELQRLHLQPDGSAVIADGRGGYSRFGAVFDGAQVTSILGPGEEVEPPATLEIGQFTNAANVRVIPERGSVELESALRVDHFPRHPLTDPSDVQGRSIRAGEVVSSYLVHFDPGGTSAQRLVTIDFDRRILGVIFEPASLDATDALLGAPLTTYPAGEASRGLDLSAVEWVDISSLESLLSGRLQLQLDEAAGMDQVRVITEARRTIVRDDLDDHGPPALNKWLLTAGNQLDTRPSGTSDLIGEGLGGTFPESGLFVVFDGDDGGLGEGWFGNLSLQPGEYELAFEAMNFGAASHALRVYLENAAFDETFQLTNGQALSPIVRRFTLAAPFVGLLNFDGGGVPDDHQGPAVDHIVLVRLEESREWVAPPGDRTELTATGSGGFVRTYPDGSEIHFDAAGLQTKHLDRNGSEVQYAYDGQDRIETIVQVISGASANPTTSFSYAGNQVTITDPALRDTVLDLDARGDLVRVTLPDQTTREFSYDARHLLQEEVGARGSASFHEYDFLGRLARARLADNTVRTATHAQAVGLVDPASGLGTQANPAPVQQPPGESILVDGEGRSTAFDLGPAGASEAVTDAATGLATLTVRDAEGNPEQTLLPSGHLVLRSFDERGNVESVTDTVLGGTTTFAYDPQHHGVTSITDNRGQTTDVSYTGVDVASIVSPLNRTASFDYGSNPDGLVDTLTDVFGTETRFVYDSETRNLAEIHQADGTPDERVTLFTYTPEGYVDTITDAELQVTDLDYDPMGRVTRQTFPGGTRFVDFTYDAAGNLETLTPPGQPAHVFRYDAREREDAYEPPDVGLPDERTLFDYNRESQLTRVTRPDGKVVDLAYDASGRLDDVTFDRGTVDLVYDANTGNLASLSAPGGETLALDYGPAASSLLHGMTWSGTVAGAVTWAFDGDGRLKDRAVNGSDLLPGDDFLYDDDGLLTGAGDLQIARAPASGFITRTDLGLVRTTLAPNPFGERASDEAVFDPAGANDLLYRNQYTARDKLGRITTKVETIQGDTTTFAYTYTEAGQLDTVHANGLLVADHAYDPNGNRTHLREDLGGPPVATYDAQDRLLSHGSATYSYTAAGDLATKQSGADLTQYQFDALGNLTQVILPDGTAIDYVIDAASRRVGKKVDGQLQWGLLYGDALNPVAQLDDQGQVSARFVYGTRPHVPDYVVKGGNTYRILSDHLGSVRLVVDAATGAIAQRIDYDVWGNPTYAVGPPDFQPFGFAGGIHDPDTGLVRFGARDYDPEVGRWTARDPIRFGGGDANLFGYVFEDPANAIDPDGLIVLKLGNFGGAGAGPSVQNQVVWAIDTSGNVGLIATASAGGQSAPSASVGLVVGFSTAPTIFDESGACAIAGASAGVGVTVGADLVFFEDRTGQRQGALEFQLGAGLGLPEAHLQVGQTGVVPLLNVPDLIRSVFDSISRRLER